MLSQHTRSHCTLHVTLYTLHGLSALTAVHSARDSLHSARDSLRSLRAASGDNTRCHSAFRNWAYGEPDDKDGADENCAIMGYHGRSNWLDVECEVTRAACLCEVNAAYGDTSGADGGDGDEGDERGGGGIDGGGVFGLILLFGVFFAVGGYFVGRPDRASAFVGTVKACLPANLPGRRAQTGASPNFSSSAGLSANDSCTPYVVPSVPGLTSSNA